ARHVTGVQTCALPIFLVQLVLGASLGAGVGTLAAALRRRLVLRRDLARLLGFALLRAGLVDGAGRDLLGSVLALATALGAVLDVLVLALTLLVPSLGHDLTPLRADPL